MYQSSFSQHLNTSKQQQHHSHTHSRTHTRFTFVRRFRATVVGAQQCERCCVLWVSDGGENLSSWHEGKSETEEIGEKRECAVFVYVYCFSIGWFLSIVQFFAELFSLSVCVRDATWDKQYTTQLQKPRATWDNKSSQGRARYHCRVFVLLFMGNKITKRVLVLISVDSGSKWTGYFDEGRSKDFTFYWVVFGDCWKENPIQVGDLSCAKEQIFCFIHSPRFRILHLPTTTLTKTKKIIRKNPSNPRRWNSSSAGDKHRKGVVCAEQSREGRRAACSDRHSREARERAKKGKEIGKHNKSLLRRMLCKSHKCVKGRSWPTAPAVD